LLNLYLQRVREEERKLISRELHDELGQSLTAIKIDLGILKNSLSNQSKISQKIEKITSLLNDSIISVQRLTSELRPHILDDLGLVAAIDWYADEYIKRTGITMNLNIDKNISLPAEIELVIFRILQESLTNIARHSKAENAEIIFYRQHSDVILEIKDDGIGISSVDRKSPKSLGLLNMSERAREIGGKFIIESRKKQGTRICLTVPDILFEE
jgi:signal transduction histidine kinase